MKMEWTWMRYSLSFSETGELQHRQLETAEAGQGLHRERREGEICLELNPAEMFGLKNFSWKWQSCWRCCKRISDPASDAVFCSFEQTRESRCSRQQDMTFKTKFMGGVLAKPGLSSPFVSGFFCPKSLVELLRFCSNFFNMSRHESILLKSTDFLLGRTLCFKKLICWVCFFGIEVYTVLGT